jgi:hypothetical protein
VGVGGRLRKRQKEEGVGIEGSHTLRTRQRMASAAAPRRRQRQRGRGRVMGGCDAPCAHEPLRTPHHLLTTPHITHATDRSESRQITSHPIPSHHTSHRMASQRSYIHGVSGMSHATNALSAIITCSPATNSSSFWVVESGVRFTPKMIRGPDTSGLCSRSRYTPKPAVCVMERGGEGTREQDRGEHIHTK